MTDCQDAVYDRCDVAVAGAGPAGIAAAIACAVAGLRVRLVEAAPFPRDRPGESLHPGIEPLLERLGVAQQVRGAGFLRHAGHWIEHKGQAHFEEFGSGWLGFQAPRALFDALLLERAAAVGVKIDLVCQVSAPILRDGRVAGLICTHGPIQARYVLDATGGRRWLLRALRIPLHQASPQLYAEYGYVTGSCRDRDSMPKFSLSEDGWLWTARVQLGRYHFTRLVTNKRAVRLQPPREFVGMDLECPIRLVDVTWRIASHCAGPGYLLLGDAAAALDPSSSQGVLRAILSGIMAAHLIRKAIVDRVTDSAIAAEYNRWMWNLFCHSATRMRALVSPPLAAVSDLPATAF